MNTKRALQRSQSGSGNSRPAASPKSAGKSDAHEQLERQPGKHSRLGAAETSPADTSNSNATQLGKQPPQRLGYWRGIFAGTPDF
ncbi:MAG: hypothetical protein ACI87E_001197 [Mariniblastus sp.]|jgi:hypothetical protein